MDTPLRVLIIEDSDRDVALEVRALKAAGYEVTYAVAETAAEMKAALLKQAFDIVISDHGMPQFDAPGALAVLKESGLDIPFIVVSGSIGEEIAVALMKAGAHDYVMKDRLSRLVPAVQKELREAESRRERKRAEEDLKESKSLIETVVENIPLMIFLKEATDLKFVLFNRAGEELLGYERKDLLGKNNLDLFPPEQAAHFMAKDREVLNGESVLMDIPEESIQTAKKGQRLLHTRKVCIKGANGATKYLLGISEDITDRKRYENEIKELGLRNQRILNAAGDGIYGLNSEGQITFINPAAAKTLGYDNQELIGKVSHDTFHHTRSDGSPFKGEDCPIYKSIKSGIAHHQSDIFIRKNGTSIPVEYTSSPIVDSGKMIGGVVSFRDITERKQAEEHLRETLESLRKAVNTTIQVMIAAVEVRDPYTAGHQARSAGLALAIATEMGLPQEKIDGIRMVSSIHDIGKLSIPAEILSKPGKLSEIEFSLIKEHSRSGYEILKDVESPWPLAQIVYQHHERMDGSGYPRNLKGDDILIEARIMAVADVVESMASHRPYRAALGINAALEEIEKNKKTLYDDTVADACLRLFREKGFQLEKA